MNSVLIMNFYTKELTKSLQDEAKKMDEHEKCLRDKEFILIENKTVINNLQQVVFFLI